MAFEVLISSKWCAKSPASNGIGNPPANSAKKIAVYNFSVTWQMDCDDKIGLSEKVPRFHIE